MYKVTIRYGLDHIEKTFDERVTIGVIRRNQSIKAALGFGDNVNLLISGTVMSDDVQVPNGATVVVETAANQKAAYRTSPKVG